MMTTKMRIISTFCLTAILLLFGCDAMTNQPLESKWQNLFREPPEVITAYSASHEIYLKNTEVEGYSLSKSDLTNDKFEDVITCIPGEYSV